MSILNAILGICLLFAGRRLYWLFVGVIGFVIGFALSGMIFSDSSEIMRIVLGLILGLIGVGLAIGLQRLAIGVAGFVAGGYILNSMMQILGLDWTFWLTFLIGGVIGAILVTMLFDPALIVLSSLLGASLLVNLLSLDRWLMFAVFLILSGVGILVQIASRRRS
jgi:hypothetical protein